MTRQEAHLLLAAVWVQAHRLGRSPLPSELAELLDCSETAVQLQLNHLRDLGAVSLVESAFATHVEIADHLCIEELTDTAGPALSEDLKEFDRRKQAEADRMANLFDSGEHRQQQQDKLGRMDEELRDFRRRKPTNPFGEDE
jgi:hypothetical protein